MIQQNTLTKHLTTLLQPETSLERHLLTLPEFVKGLYWGVPRYGHPEGEVYKHVREVLDNINDLSLSTYTRTQLRLVAFVHDTFKYAEDKTLPRDWSKHHGSIARRFMEDFIEDKILLNIIELHDEAYYCWRALQLHNQLQVGELRLQRLFEAVGDEIQLYYLFFKCDTRTGDKNQAPLKWFEKNIAGIEIVNW